MLADDVFVAFVDEYSVEYVDLSFVLGEVSA
jgi:hypothetical protein